MVSTFYYGGNMAREVKSDEQWKLNGICSKCARYKYCNKECKVHKRKKEQAIRAAILAKMFTMR